MGYPLGWWICIMSLEQGIRTILATLGNEIKIHKLDEENIILEIDYEKYIKQILGLIEND